MRNSKFYKGRECYEEVDKAHFFGLPGVTDEERLEFIKSCTQKAPKMIVAKYMSSDEKKLAIIQELLGDWEEQYEDIATYTPEFCITEIIRTIKNPDIKEKAEIILNQLKNNKKEEIILDDNEFHISRENPLNDVRVYTSFEELGKVNMYGLSSVTDEERLRHAHYCRQKTAIMFLGKYMQSGDFKFQIISMLMGNWEEQYCQFATFTPSMCMEEIINTMNDEDPIKKNANDILIVQKGYEAHGLSYFDIDENEGGEREKIVKRVFKGLYESIELNFREKQKRELEKDVECGK